MELLMPRALAAATLLALSTLCVADGPGSRIRAGPGVPAVPGQPMGPVEKDLQRCDALRAEAKERCMREIRAAMRGSERAPHEGPNPESTGMGAGAGSG